MPGLQTKDRKRGGRQRPHTPHYRMADWSAMPSSSNRSLPLGGQHLAFLAEADAFMVCQFEGEGLDFEFGGVQGRLVENDGLPGRVQFGKQPVEFARGQSRPARQGWLGGRRKGSQRRIQGVVIPRENP